MLVAVLAQHRIDELPVAVQNRYTGDIGDYGKYGLLRALTGDDLRAGVVWYLTPDESHNDDGGYVQYLLPEREQDYRRCDPALYDGLRRLVMSGRRDVTGVRVRGLLPPGTVFYESILSYAGAGPGAQSRVRREWHEQALRATADCGLVLLDPDNGIAFSEGTRASVKHATLAEIGDHLRQGASVVVYHHLGRTASHEQQIEQALARLSLELGAGTRASAVRFSAGSGRVYFVVATPQHLSVIEQRLSAFLDGQWASLFAGAVSPEVR